MEISINDKPNWKLAVGIPSFIFLACFFITLCPKFKLNQDLFSNAILIDLLVTAPLAYFFVIRKTATPKITVTRVFIAGLIIAGLILDTKSNTLHIIKLWISPFIEATVIFFIGRKFYIVNKRSERSGKYDADFLIYCRKVMALVIGNEKAANIISSEIAVLYFTFIAGRNKKIDYQTKFTSYKENGIIAVLALMLFTFLIETAGVHFLLNVWSSKAAWIVTALSLYTCLQLYAHIKAMKARPVKLYDDALEIHNGLAGDALIKYKDIEKIELSNKTPIDRSAIKIALIKGLENHNCVIYLKRSIAVTKMFGIKKSADTILFFVDRPKDFISSLNSALVGVAVMANTRARDIAG
jgi:hypothetical protein